MRVELEAGPDDLALSAAPARVRADDGEVEKLLGIDLRDLLRRERLGEETSRVRRRLTSVAPARVAEHQNRVAGLLNESRQAVNGASVLIPGVAYKRDVGDLRESPALDVIRLLAGKGASVSFHDPHVNELEVDGRIYKNRDLGDEALAAADLVVILTDHSAIDYPRVVAQARRIFDTRNATAAVEHHREKITRL